MTDELWLAGKVNGSIAKNYGVIHGRFVEELKKRKGEGAEVDGEGA